MTMFEKIFHLNKHHTTVKKEVLAGITTFMTMAYILAVNPTILSATGMDKNALFTATALSAVIATLVMAFAANYPFALAPGMGLNAFFAYTVVIGMGYSWQFALTAVLLEGIVFVLLTTLNIRELIVNTIPMNLKHAISVGLGLFIAFIGLQGAEIVVDNPATLLSLGNMKSAGVLLALGGIILTGVLLQFKVKGALLIGILVTTIAGIPAGITHIPDTNLVGSPPSLKPILFQFDFSQVFSFDMLIVLFTFLFMDMFDSVGSFIGVADKANMLDKNGKLPRAKQALYADSIGTTVGAMLGTSTVTTYVESASGVAEGGRTGLTAVATALMFALALFFAPIFTMIPAAATAPTLVVVGLFMMSPIKNIDLQDYTEAIPAFITFIGIPLTYSISEGIAFGMISYVLLKLFTGRHKEISVVMVVLSALFIVKFMI